MRRMLIRSEDAVLAGMMVTVASFCVSSSNGDPDRGSMVTGIVSG
jgi:hypothetical protein